MLIIILSIYILREFKKVNIIFFTFKNIPKLINLSLFLKIRIEVKTINRQKSKEKNLLVINSPLDNQR